MTTPQQIPKGEVYLLLFIIAVIFLIVGMTCNFKAIEFNEGRMPVKNCDINTAKHIGFYDNREVNYSYLGDILHIGNSIYSIGDILMYIGLLTMFPICFLYCRLLRKRKSNIILPLK